MTSMDDPFRSSSITDENFEEEEPGSLLEEHWFFGNLLQTKTANMSRSYSHPCPSSNYTQDNLVTNSNESKSSLRRDLVRVPSLPPWIGREEVEDEESEFTMGRLIRQASLNLSDMLPPRHNPKAVRDSFSRPRRKSLNMEGCKETRRRNLINQNKIGRSLNDLETEEVQGFKDLGFKFDNEDLNPSVVNILPGLQERNRVDSVEEEGEVSRPYLSESWEERNSAPTIPNWVDKRSKKDIKAQIKFWARAVASNVRQEC